jgi:ABC-type Zn uptake system ZnuABC Zn-binding protein ZnuA
MIMNFYKILILFFILVSFNLSATPIKVVTTTTTLASIAKEIGGNHVLVTYFVEGKQDLHYVTPRPSMVKDLQDADLLIRVGMSLDSWVDGLTGVAKNKVLFDGKPGYLDASVTIDRLDVPTGRIDGGMGDIHVEGNPHYYLDPLNGIAVAKAITQKLCQLSPNNAPYFKSRLLQFTSEIHDALPVWATQLEAISGYQLITYHTTWRYFANRFNLTIAGQLEPKPGIPPTAKHLMLLKKVINSNPKTIIIQADFHPTLPAKSLTRGSSIDIVTLPTEVAFKSGQRYIEFISAMIKSISEHDR